MLWQPRTTCLQNGMTSIGSGSSISIKNQDNPVQTWPQANLIEESPQLRFYCWMTLGCVKVTVKSYPSALYSPLMKYMVKGDSSTSSFLVIASICDRLLSLWTWPNLESPGSEYQWRSFFTGLACGHVLPDCLKIIDLRRPKPVWVVAVPRQGSWIVYGWRNWSE